MNVRSGLIELLLADELDLDAVKANVFFQEVQKAQIVKFGERDLASRLRDSILYSMLVFRQKWYAGGDTSSALEALICEEARLVGEENVDSVFNEFRRAVTQKFDHPADVEQALRRIETLRGGGNPPCDKKRQPAKKRRKQACPATIR